MKIFNHPAALALGISTLSRTRALLHGIIGNKIQTGQGLKAWAERQR